MNSDILEIKHLRMIAEINRQGGLTAASRTLFLSQPALSRRLSQLEERLGLELFHRVGKRLRLTAAGEAVLETAQAVLPEMALTQRKLQRIRMGDEGSIRLCTECFTCYHWMPPVVKRFRRQYPGIDIEINTEDTSNPHKALLAGRIDLGICNTTVSDSRLISRPLFDDEFVAVVLPDHPFAGRSWLKPGDFGDQHVVVYSATGSDVIERFLKPAGVSPKKISSVSLTSGIIQMVQAGLGVAFLTRWIVDQHPEGEGLVTVPLSASGLWRRWSAVMRKETDNGAVRDLVDLLRRSNPSASHTTQSRAS